MYKKIPGGGQAAGPGQASVAWPSPCILYIYIYIYCMYLYVFVYILIYFDICCIKSVLTWYSIGIKFR